MKISNSVESIAITPDDRPIELQNEALQTTPLCYDDYRKILRGDGTVCIPTVRCGEVPPPEEAMADEMVHQVWNEVVKESSQRVTRQIGQEAQGSVKAKTKEIAKLLESALQSGNIDLAMLLVSGLETRETNEIAGGLLRRIDDLQGQRKAAADQMSQLGKSSDEDAKKIQSLNIEVGNIGTEIQTLQTFLQDVMSQKSEAQQMASNFLKQRHETAMGIIRNTG